jgi:hypothetical protein
METCNEWKSTDDLHYTLTVEPSSAQSLLFSFNKNPSLPVSNDMIQTSSRRQMLLQGSRERTKLPQHEEDSLYRA